MATQRMARRLFDRLHPDGAMTIGRCNDCGGRDFKYVVYEWSGKPLLRDAICPKHGTPLERTTTPKRSAKHGLLVHILGPMPWKKRIA